MPGRIEDTLWDFGPALALNNERHYVDTSGEKADPQDHATVTTEGTHKLGDFGELWKLLGQYHELPPPATSPASSEENLPGIAELRIADVGIDFSSSSEDNGGGIAPRGARRCKVGKEAVAPLTASEEAPKVSADPEDLETPSEWAREVELRVLARKEKKRLKKEQRKAERLTMAGVVADAGALKNEDLSKSSPMNIPGVNMAAPRTPKRVESPYRAEGTIKILARPPASKSPKKDPAQIEASCASLVDILHRVSPEGLQSTHDRVPVSTPNHSAPRSQPQTPAVPTKAALVPQSAPAKSIFPLYPSVVQPPISQPKFQAVTSGSRWHRTIKAIPVEPQLQETAPQPSSTPNLVETADPIEDAITKAQAYGFKVGPDRQFELFLKLYSRFPLEKKWLVSPMQLSNNKADPTGIHVFVDASNILIGFSEEVKRVLGLGTWAPTPFTISFDSLALLMERRRPVAKRVLVGSTPEVPAFETARQVGYSVDTLEKVKKVKELTERQKYFKQQEIARSEARATRRRSVGGGGNGQGSSSETSAPPEDREKEKKWMEQGVDELLHLKMAQSLLDADEPSTIVLATGDAAAAEYSEGFKKMVERALKKGWYVELVSWKRQISNEWRKPKFLEAWGRQFQILELDNYVADLLDV